MDYELQEFIKERIIVQENGCWKWTRGLGSAGGIVCNKWSKRYDKTSAHNLSYIAWYGRYDRRLHVHQECKNKLCCNPQHLYLGPPAGNVALTRLEINAISALLGKMPNKEIAALFNTSESVVELMESCVDFM